VVSTPKEKAVRGPKRKRGPPKKAPVVTPPTKDTPPSTSETDITSDVPVVPPQCPTKTKVLPPRKGRGQKYEAMVQKITSPSSKKHLPIPQIDSNLTDDVTTKALSQQVLKEGETSMLINSTERIEGEVKSIESRQEGVKQQEGTMRKDEVTQEREKHVVTPSEMRQGVEEEVANKEVTRLESIKPEIQQDVGAHKAWSTTEVPVEVSAPGEWTQQASEGVSTTASKSSRTKRKRWAMVESADASAVALEAGSLIVTTPRLAKQRAIKNNHEMHLKQRRKKRKGQAALEETEPVEETNIETAEQLEERAEENVSPTESTLPLPISPDEITEAPQVTSTELIQKPRRGRKPSANPTKRKRGKASSEQIPGIPVKVHKKPGPKPGMKDAIEVIEAVPANYRDLGDLCGPYYTEDGVPRKILTTRHTESLREESEKSNDSNCSSSEKPGDSSKNEAEGSTENEGNTEASTQEGSSSRHHHWRYRRAERTERAGREGGTRRLTLRERFRRMKQLQAISTGVLSDQEGSDSVFQRLQLEAEAKEHWAHENCAIWTKGIIMVAGRLYGLKEAASNSAQTSCYKCQIVGASLSCCWRGCSHKYHYVCAKEIGCTFHEDDFSIICPKHEDL
ncbi:retinoic acid-induced protein 1, partial [Lates japonicus]